MSAAAIRPLNPQLQAVARDQLNEVPEKIQESLEIFREWIKKSPHLKARTDDQFLVTFLRGCKYSLERAKQKLDMYYTLRTHIPEIIQGRDPLDEKLHAIIKLGGSLPLPQTETPGSPRLVLMRGAGLDPDKFTIEDSTKVSMMVNEIMMLEDDNMAVSGIVGVMDMQGFSMSHFAKMQMSFMKKMTMMMEQGTPIRQKGFHYINVPQSFETIFNIFKGFLNEKMKSRLYVHSSYDSLYKVIPRRLMPTEYEGEAGSIASLTEEWEKKILSYRDYFLEESSIYGVDERKRVGRPKNPESLFGIDGTFRQLQFD